MLEYYFSVHKKQFETLARAWINLGATGVQLCEGEKVLASYPFTGEFKDPTIVAEHNSSKVRLLIYGPSNLHWNAIAEALVEIFGSLFNSEAEIEEMTAALVEVQDRLVALYDLTQAARSLLEVNDLLDYLVEQIHHLLNAAGAFVFIQIGEEPATIRKAGIETISDEDVQNIVQNYLEDTDRHFYIEEPSFSCCFKNIIIVSLPVREGVLAVMGAGDKVKGYFTSADIKLAQAVSDLAGALLENALLYLDAIARTRFETEMAFARRIQESLFPETFPQVHGIDIYGVSKPAYQVGGDFLDVIEIPNRPFSFVLGDVAGKGIPAALMMGMIYTVTHSALVNMPFSRPDQVVSRLNNDLQDVFSKVGLFTTAFIGLWDDQNHKLAFTNAGQSPIIFLPKSGEPQLLEAEDIPIGVFDKYAYTSQEMHLNSGDILLVATDGLVEAHNVSDEMYTYERLKDHLSKIRDLTARKMCNEILNRILDFSAGHPQDDDQTLFVIKVL